MTAQDDMIGKVLALEALDLEGLRTAWRNLYGPPPKLRSPDLLRIALAWRIQSGRFGGLEAGTRRRLRDGVSIGQRDHVSLGSRIVREWHGQVCEIDRIEGGYRWRGETYRSLSALAQAITGVKRNGPRFFGLRDEEAA